MFFQSYHKTTSNKNDEYNRIDTAAITESQNALRTHQQQQQQYLAATRGAAFARPGLNNAPGRYNLLPLKSLANIFSNQILSLARFDGGSHGSCAEECEMAAQPAIEDEEQPRRLADERDLSAAESNEDFMKFTEIFNYLSEEEDFEPSSSSSSSPSPTPSTSPLSSTFSLSLSASNSSMSSLRAKTNVEQLNTQPDSASILNESVGKMDEDEKKMTGDMDTVSIDSLPLSSALSTSMMSVNTIASANSAGEYSSSLPATSTLAELPAAIASSEQPVEVEKPSLDLSGTEVYQKSLSTSTPALSSMTTQLSLTKPSPEFVVESVLNSPLKSKPIWSSALYLPCLHPALFELNSAHSVSCLTTTSNESKLVNPRKYDLTPQAPTPCVSWSCTLEANDFNPFNNKSTPSYVDQMNGVAEHNLKFLNENRFSAAAAFNPTNAYNADHNDFINFKSLAQLRNNLNFINKYFQSNYSQMNDFNRGYSQQQQQMMNEAEYDMSNNQTEMQQADSAAEFGMNNFANSNFNNRINSQNYNHAGGYFNSNYRSNAFNRSSKRRYRNNGCGGGYQFNQQYQSGSASYQHSQRNSLIIDDSTPAASNFYGHSSYESDSLPASNRHSMVIGGDGDFDVYKLKSNLKHGEEMGSLPSMLTNDEGLKTGSRSVESSSLDVHHKTNDDSQQQTNEFVDYSSGRTTSNKFLPPRFEKKWTDQYQPGSGFYSAQKDDMSVKNRNYSFRMSNNSNNSNNMSFNGKFFTMPAKKNSNNFNYNSQYNLNSSGNQQQQQQQQIMSTSLYGNGPTSASTSSSSSSPTSSPPTRHVLRRQNAIRLNHNQRYQHQNSNNNYQFSAKSLSTNSNNQFQQQASSNAAPSCQGPDCQPEQSYRYHHNHHQYNQMQSQQQPQQQQQGNNANSRYRPQGQTSGMTASTGTANKTCRF